MGNDINMIKIKSGKNILQPHFIVMLEKILEPTVCKIVRKSKSIENEGKGTKGNKKYGLLKHMSNSNAGMIPLL